MSNCPSHRMIWSYSVYGDNHEMYFKPLLEVIPLANHVGARVVINTPRAYHAAVLQYFRDYLNDITVLGYDGPIAEAYPKILRFLVSARVNSEFYFYKDSDSLVGTKELAVMTHWMNSAAATCMIIRDHPQHVTPILAGMFGLARIPALSIATAAQNHFAVKRSGDNGYSYDQEWLMDHIYPAMKVSAQVYTSYFYYSGERVFRISRSLTGCAHIGAQCFQSSTAASPCRWYDSIYGDRLLCAPFIEVVNRLLPRLLYGRVRPTLLMAFIYSRFLRMSRMDQFNILRE